MNKALVLLVPALILSACTKTDPATASLEKRLTLPIGGGNHTGSGRANKPHEVNSLRLASSPTDPLLQGKPLSLDDAAFTLMRTTIDGRQILTFELLGDHKIEISFSSPETQTLTLGTYDYVRDVGHEFIHHAGLTISIDGKQTATTNSRLQILDWATDSKGVITTFAADFQIAEAAAAQETLSGSLRFNSPKPIPGTVAIPASPDPASQAPSLIEVAGRISNLVTGTDGDFALSNAIANDSESVTIQFARTFPNSGDGVFTYTATPTLTLGMDPHPAAQLAIDLGQCGGAIRNLNVLELERDASQKITKFSANFDLACDGGGAPQKGYLRFHSLLSL